MTVSTLTNSIVYQGNGATTTFTFPFPAVAANYLDVTYTDASGNVTLLPKNQYSVFLNAPIAPNPTEIGGYITYPLTGTPIPIGTSLTIARNLPGTQATSLANQSTLYQAVIEAALDYVTMLTQQNSNLVENALLFPLSDPPGLGHTLPPVVQRSGQFVTFDGSGNVAVAIGVASGATISSFMQPFCNSANLTTAQSFLGINQAAQVPVGAEFDFVGYQAPQYYFMELGQEVSRTGYPELFNAMCPLYSTSYASGVVNITMPSRLDGLSSVTGIRIGTPVEGVGIPSGTSVINLGTSWINISNATTSSGTSIRLFPYNNGNGASTFHLPDSRGLVVAGLDPQNATGRLTASTAGSVSGAAIGNYGGEQQHAITANEMYAHQHVLYPTDPGHTHTYSGAGTFNAAGGGAINGAYASSGDTGVGYTGMLFGSSPGANDWNTTISGASWAHNNVQPTHIRLKIIYAGRATF